MEINFWISYSIIYKNRIFLGLAGINVNNCCLNSNQDKKKRKKNVEHECPFEENG